MKIGELAQRSGLSRDTIRFYERNGLIRSLPSRAATNTYREYPEETLKRLTFVTRARDAGMSVADLADIFKARCDTEIAKGMLRDKVVELERRAEQIDKVVALLKETLAAID